MKDKLGLAFLFVVSLVFLFSLKPLLGAILKFFYN